MTLTHSKYATRIFPFMYNLEKRKEAGDGPFLKMLIFPFMYDCNANAETSTGH